MPEFSLADILGAQAGAPGPVYEGGPNGNVRPGELLTALARLPVGGIEALSKYLGVPAGETRNAAGEVVFPTNAFERGLQSTDTAAGQYAAAVMGPGAKGGRIAAPAIREQNAPLFEYSRLSDVPNVPQFDLPRAVPPQGVPEATQALAAPKNVARVNEAVRAGEAMGGREWYNTEPLREQFVSELGDTAGNQAYRQYMDLVAANSPRTRVPENIRNASYYYGTERRGEDLPRTYFREGYHRMTKETQAPTPYGIMPIHVQNMMNLREGGLPVLQNPKPASFVENLAGNQTPVTIDTHNMRLLTGAREADVPKPNEYGFLERLQQGEATKMGMTPAQYQASAWIGGGKETGLASPTDPFLRVLEDRVAKTAEATGRTKAQVLADFIQAKSPLLSLGGVIAGAGLDRGQSEPAP